MGGTLGPDIANRDGVRVELCLKQSILLWVACSLSFVSKSSLYLYLYKCILRNSGHHMRQHAIGEKKTPKPSTRLPSDDQARVRSGLSSPTAAVARQNTATRTANYQWMQACKQIMVRGGASSLPTELRRVQ